MDRHDNTQTQVPNLAAEFSASSVLTDMSLALSAMLCVLDEMDNKNRLRDMILADHKLSRRVEIVASSQTNGLFGDPRTVVACKTFLRDIKQEHEAESSKSITLNTAVVVLNSPRVSNMNKYESFTKESNEDDESCLFKDNDSYIITLLSSSQRMSYPTE